jgi:hypothetical protein
VCILDQVTALVPAFGWHEAVRCEAGIADHNNDALLPGLRRARLGGLIEREGV